MRHLSETDILLFLNDDLPIEKRKNVEKHISGCDLCSEKLADIYRLEEDLQSSNPPEINPETLEKAKKMVKDGKNSTFLFSNFRRLSAAAVILIVGFLAFWLWTGPNSVDHQDAYRSSSESTVVQPLEPGDGESLHLANPEFTWEPVPNAASYRLVIFSENGVELWSKQVEDTHQKLPEDLPMKTNNRYLWKTEAILPDGRVVSSPLRSFQLKRK